MESINDVPLLIRREIEARMIAPFLKAFEKEIGEERTHEIAANVIASLAEEAGQEIAKKFGGVSLMDIKEKVVPLFAAGGSVQAEYPEANENCIQMDIVRCEYVEMYRRLGLLEYGNLLSCQRDEFTFRGLNPNVKFSRTKTLMESGDYCDFRLETDKKDSV